MKALSNRPDGQNWFFKYRLYHIPFWFAYHFTWWSITIGNPLAAATDIFSSVFFVKFIFYVVFQAIAVYFNLYYLIPRYLEKRKFAVYIVYLLLTIICAAALIVTGYYVSAALRGQTVRQMYGFEGCSYPFLINSLPSTVASTTLAMSIKFAKNWLQTQRRQQVLEKEKLETELKFLKNQFNPHYLFNTINSIFFLIHKNPDRASASLAKFSELLRYQLYECNDQQIPLSKEIAYLENFIALEKLRQNTNMDISVELEHTQGDDAVIAPFILMTFVENAFKHVSKHTNQPNWIKISLVLQGQQLMLMVKNSATVNGPVGFPYYGGIGLENVQRRLELIYQGKYNLDIENRGDNFEVRLVLQLAGLPKLNALQKIA